MRCSEAVRRTHHAHTRWWLLAVVVASSAALAEEPIVLEQGGAKVLTVQAVTRVTVGDPSVVEVKALGPGQLQLTALTAGETAVVAFKADGTQQRFVVQVRRRAPPTKQQPAAAPGR